jgi:MFS family permease
MNSETRVVFNVSIASFVAFANYNIIIIALPAILNGLDFNPNSPSSLPYIVWLIVGYMTVTASFLSLFGRVGDVYGKVKVFRVGFLIFSVSALLMSLLPPWGDAAVLALILLRVIQGVGGGFLMSNGTAIIADLIPRNKLGYALSLTQSMGLVGGVMGLVLGGVLAFFDWRLVFLFPAVVGLLGYLLTSGLPSFSARRSESLDWQGGLLFASSLTLILIGTTLMLVPGEGVASYWLIAMGVLTLLPMIYVERKARSPLFVFSLFKHIDFSIAIASNTLVSGVRQGLTILIIILLQAVWLPLHGVPFSLTPLLAGLYMLPNSIGFMVAAPVAGRLSDRLGSKKLTTAGLSITAISTLALYFLPYDFQLWQLFAITFFSGLGMGLFSAPNLADIMASAPPNYRGATSGMRGTLQNTASAVSVAVYFTLLFLFLYQPLINAELSFRLSHVVPPPVVVFSALLGYDPFPGVNLDPKTFGGLVAEPFMEAFKGVVLVSFAITALTVPLNYLRKDARVRESQARVKDVRAS